MTKHVTICFSQSSNQTVNPISQLVSQSSEPVSQLFCQSFNQPSSHPPSQSVSRSVILSICYSVKLYTQRLTQLYKSIMPNVTMLSFLQNKGKELTPLNMHSALQQLSSKKCFYVQDNEATTRKVKIKLAVLYCLFSFIAVSILIRLVPLYCSLFGHPQRSLSSADKAASVSAYSVSPNSIVQTTLPRVVRLPTFAYFGPAISRETGVLLRQNRHDTFSIALQNFEARCNLAS